MGESAAETPNTDKRKRCGDVWQYNASTKKTFDISPQELNLLRACPISRAKSRLIKNPQKLCREIQDVDGSGDQILPTLGGGVVGLQNETVGGARIGFRMSVDGKWPVGLGNLA